MVTFHPRTLRKETSNQYSIQSNPQRSCVSVRANRRRKRKISAARAYPPPFGGARPPHVSAHQKSRVRPAFGSLVRRLEGGLPDVQSWDPPHPSPRACSDDEGQYVVPANRLLVSPQRRSSKKRCERVLVWFFGCREMDLRTNVDSSGSSISANGGFCRARIRWGTCRRRQTNQSGWVGTRIFL